MNGKNIYDAMEYVGPDLIGDAEQQRFSRPLWQILLPIAAMAALLIGSGAAAVRHLQPPVVVPPPAQEVQIREEPALPEVTPTEPAEPVPEIHPLQAQFPLLDPDTLPAESNDWGTFYINEAGPEDSGTDIYTLQGDPVLAVDAQNGILLIRVQDEGYRGILAIVKDPQRLSQQASSQIGISGETAGVIAEAHNGILAITGSRILDEGGNITGRAMAAYTMCDGVVYQEDEHLEAGFFRLEIDAQGQFHLTDSQSPVTPDTQNAVEIPVVLIRDGQILVEESATGPHPRACLGQTETGEILMLVIEGRRPDEGIFGIDQWSCAEILKRYGCENGVQLDTGTSAILWFDGEYVTNCSNKMLPEGRPLPSAFVISHSSNPE